MNTLHKVYPNHDVLITRSIPCCNITVAINCIINAFIKYTKSTYTYVLALLTKSHYNFYKIHLHNMSRSTEDNK